MSPFSKPVVRFAPSPTGRTHLGSARTALYNYAFARQNGGTFILRIEDTDRKRYVPGAEKELMESLRWLGLDWDEGPDVGGPHAPYYQSQRREIYQEHARWLVEHGHAYYCFCSPERLEQVRQAQVRQKQNPRYDGLCRHISPDEAAARVARGERHVVRFKMPQEGSITVRDLLRGEITVENSSLDDSILIKSDGLALYHLAAMVDDHLMGVTHVIRGSEWLSTLPLHAHILRAFGWSEPIFVHLSIFLKPSGKGKMSKREAAQAMQDGYSIFISDLKELGYLPEAVVNWIALMGWSYDDHTEFFTLGDIIEKFRLERLNPSPAAINFTKLDHFNGLHIRHLPAQELARRMKPFLEQRGYLASEADLERLVPLVQERLVTLDEAPQWLGFFFQEEVYPSSQDLIGAGMDAAASLHAAQRALALLESQAVFTAAALEAPLRALAQEMGLQAGQLFGILRVAVTGQKVSPPLLESMEVLGKERVLARLRRAMAILETSSAGGEGAGNRGGG